MASSPREPVPLGEILFGLGCCGVVAACLSVPYLGFGPVVAVWLSLITLAAFAKLFRPPQ